jgi:nucleoporin NUP159
MRKPTVEAVAQTIATMTNMAEKKSGDIDVLEAQLRRLGLDLSGPSDTGSREGSPFRTPGRKVIARIPMTPGSRGSRDDGNRSVYHTPDSAKAGPNFRSSMNGSARKSLLRMGGELTLAEDTERWKTKAQRRKEIVENLKRAVRERKIKVRGVDDL